MIKHLHAGLQFTPSTNKLTMIHAIAQSALVAASFLASAQTAAAQGGAAVQNQLQMARLPQAAQRSEFPLEGEESAFKFSFLDDVRYHPVQPSAPLTLCIASAAGLLSHVMLQLVLHPL